MGLLALLRRFTNSFQGYPWKRLECLKSDDYNEHRIGLKGDVGNKPAAISDISFYVCIKCT